MTISVGSKAPDFTLVTIGQNGPELVKLSEQIGEENVLLLFVPMAFTGGCTTELCTISKTMEEYSSLGAKVLGITGDNPFANAEWAEKEGMTMTILSDYEHLTTKAYGIAYDSFYPEKNLIMGGVPKRSAFVVDKEGIVQYAEVLDVPSEMPDFDAIKACLKNL